MNKLFEENMIKKQDENIKFLEEKILTEIKEDFNQKFMSLNKAIIKAIKEN